MLDERRAAAFFRQNQADGPRPTPEMLRVVAPIDAAARPHLPPPPAAEERTNPKCHSHNLRFALPLELAVGTRALLLPPSSLPACLPACVLTFAVMSCEVASTRKQTPSVPSCQRTNA